jgi:glycerate dehydrogenase
MGKIAQKVGSIASAFDMDIHYHSRTFKKLPFDATYWSELHKMLPMVDYLSLHCPLKPETHQIINDRTISQLKSNCLVINTGRGQLIDENALADALNQGRIKGACVDVLTKEPPTSTNPLLNAANCLVTPHIGWRSKQARQRAITQTYENIEAFLNGNMIRAAIVTA